MQASTPDYSQSGALFKDGKQSDGIMHNDAGEVMNLGDLTRVRRVLQPHTYVIQIVGTQFIKVGSTSNLRARIVALATSVPWEVEFIFAVVGPTEDAHIYIEKFAQGYLAEYHVRREWFAVSPDVAKDAVRKALRDVHTILAGGA